MAELLVLSPHRDDAIFSLAIALGRWSSCARISILNFFTTSSYAPRVRVEDCSAANLSRIRRREDRRALRSVVEGIRVIDCGLLDAPIRLGVQTAAVSGPDASAVRTEDVELVAEQVRRLARKASAIIGPLGLGNHIDHRTVREAAMRVVPPKRLAFYEDLPYATWTTEEQLTGIVAGLRRPLLPKLVRPAACNVFRKRGLARLYSSQIAPAEAGMIAGYSAKYRSAERVWIPAHSRIWSELAPR